MKKSAIASLIGLAFTTPLLAIPVFAVEQINLDEVTVKANRFERKDTETTYASEIHTSKQIEESGAATLYDFLAQQTSLAGMNFRRISRFCVFMLKAIGFYSHFV